MKKYILPTLFFALVFTFYPPWYPDWAVHIQLVWIWDKKQGVGTRPYFRSQNPFYSLSGYKIPGLFYSFQAGRFFSYAEDRLIEYSLLEEGFYEYKKIGSEVSYYNGYRELFWKKPYSSYPRPGYYSSIIPFVSGDGNTVFLVDRNGNLAGAESLDGRFAVDICFSTEKDFTMVLFSGGEFGILDSSGNVVTKHNPQETEAYTSTYFAKSCAISPNGKVFAIHYLQGDKDRIRLEEIGQKAVFVDLERVYPHRISIAVLDNGFFLLSLKEGAVLYSSFGKKVFEKKEELDPYYNPILPWGNYFLWGSKKKFYVWDSKGKEIYSYNLQPEEYPYRFIPPKPDFTKNEAVLREGFYLETRDYIRQFYLIDSELSHR